MEFRLSGDHDPSKGKVEVGFDGVWGTLCNLEWTMPDARVLCKQMGYIDGAVNSDIQYPPGNGPVWVDHFQCEGTEASVFTCTHTGWDHPWEAMAHFGCSRHFRDATVECFNNPIGEEQKNGGVQLKLYRKST